MYKTVCNINTIRLVRESTKKTYLANSSRNIPAILQEILEIDTYNTEIFGVICNDTSTRVVGLHILSQGDINSCTVSPAEVCKAALLNNSNSIILFHNHPAGSLSPSHQDLMITKKIQDACKMFDIKVLDHIIMGIGGQSYSLAEQNQI